MASPRRIRFFVRIHVEKKMKNWISGLIFNWYALTFYIFSVPRKVLKERYEEPPLEDEAILSGSRDNNDYDEFDGYESIDDFFRESAAYSPQPNSDLSSVINVTEPTLTTPQIKNKNSGKNKIYYYYYFIAMCMLCNLVTKRKKTLCFTRFSFFLLLLLSLIEHRKKKSY